MHNKETMSDEELIEHIKTVQLQYTDQLMALPNVIGISIGLRDPETDLVADESDQKSPKPENEYAIIVMVDKVVEPDHVPVEERIPEELDGVPIIVRQVGTLSAFGTDVSA